MFKKLEHLFIKLEQKIKKMLMNKEKREYEKSGDVCIGVISKI